jgi:hypothetical protein
MFPFVQAGGGKPKQSKANIEFLNTLEIGSYLDFQKPNGMWEFVTLSAVYPAVAEIELTFSDG